MDLTVGMQVILRPTGNYARYIKDPIVGTISKIGKKYFYVDTKSHRDKKFDKVTGKYINDDCNSSFVIYFSERAYLDDKEKGHLITKITYFFRHSSLEVFSLEQLKEIGKIIESR